MKVQLKKGVLEIYVLAILTKKDSYGYEIVSNLSKHIEITESTLYPILKRLEASNELETYNQLHNSRNRKYYKIKKQGKDHINNFLELWEETIKVYEDIIEGEIDE